MKIGVVYKFKKTNKVNGTLFYCYEHCQFLRQLCDCVLYVVGATQKDALLTTQLFDAKYNKPTNGIRYLDKTTELYALGLDKTLVLDIDTFDSVKEFLTNDVMCFSNETHSMYRYRNDRRVTYFGSYGYQRYDVFSYLKLHFGIFRPCSSSNGVFVSGTGNYIVANASRFIAQFAPIPVIIKRQPTGAGDIFDQIDTVHYVHSQMDTNNRIIPEAFFHGKRVTMEEPFFVPIDSVMLRYQDILANGLANYTLTEHDLMIQACLQ